LPGEKRPDLPKKHRETYGKIGPKHLFDRGKNIDFIEKTYIDGEHT
jgi:hypothetical protein